jgi:hypothetical protein
VVRVTRNQVRLSKTNFSGGEEMSSRSGPYKVNSDTKRPYRIWDAKGRKHVTGRAYTYWRNAQNGALQIVRWGKVGDAVEVYDIRTGRLIGQYVRKPKFVWFSGVEE